jgi:hypothetical protein
VINDYELSLCSIHGFEVECSCLKAVSENKQAIDTGTQLLVLVNAEVKTDLLANLIVILSTSVLVTQYLSSVQDAV